VNVSIRADLLGFFEVSPVGSRWTFGPAGEAHSDHYVSDGDIVYRQACKLGCEGIVSKRLGSPYCCGRSRHWLKVKNPAAPAVRREVEEDWGC
jgi:hypothetical protein